MQLSNIQQDLINDGMKELTDPAFFTGRKTYAVFDNVFTSTYIDHTGGSETIVFGGESEATATDLNSTITSVSSGDVISLRPAAGSNYGHFKCTHQDLWEGKSFAFVGDGSAPDKIFIWHDHDGVSATRDHPLFAGSLTALGAASYQKFAYNLTYHRHQISSTNYIASLAKPTGSVWGGSMLNCIIDLNNGGVAWNYDNTNSNAYFVSYKHCTFLNYNSWYTAL